MRQFPIVLVSRKEEERQPPVPSIYGGQLRGRGSQHSPLLVRHQVSRRYGIVWRRTLTDCEHVILRAARCLVPALGSLNFIVLLGQPVPAALEACRIGA